jgi:putative aldouronate transport system substrate-binding protein
MLMAKFTEYLKNQRFWPDTGTRQYVNHKWLDNLGLEMPTNWDELLEVLIAFKEQAANDNGDPNDEIPMDWAPVGTGGFGYFHPTVLLGSTGIALTAGGGQGFFVEDGQVKNFFVDERYKTFVKFLHEAWVAGVINPEVFTQDYSKFMANSKGDIKDETARVGYSFGWGNSDRFGNILYDQYTSMPALKVSADSTAELKWSYAHEQMNIMDNMVALSATSKNKKAAMRFVNELYDPEVSLQVLFGSIGPNISKNDDGSYTILPPKDESMDPGQWKWTSTWADNGPMFISDSLEVDLPIDMKQVLDESKPLQSAIDNIDKKKDLYPSFVEFSPDENSTIIRNNTSLMNIAMPKFGLWITEGGIDAEWDAYVEKFQSNGMQKNVEIMQKYYDEIIINQ